MLGGLLACQVLLQPRPAAAEDTAGLQVAQSQPAEPAAPAEPQATPATPEKAPSTPEAGEAAEDREVTRVPLVGVERGGVLLGSGQLTIEPRFNYSHTTSSRLILTGFSVIPLVILGTLESEKVTTDSLGATLNLGYGLLRDTQVNVQIPYVYTTSQTVRLSNDQVALTEENASVNGLGDISFGASYQVLKERNWWPDVTLGLSVKAPTGRSQFDIYKDIAKDPNGFSSIDNFVKALAAQGLPTGSGFWSASGSISFVRSLDPAVLFGTFGYTHSFERTVTLIALTGIQAEGGVILRPVVQDVKIQPGDAVSLSIGIALSLSRELSFNFSFSDSVAFPTKRDGEKVGDTRTNVGMFSAGFTLALSRNISLDFTGSAGLTSDAPDFSIGFGLPMRFDSFNDLVRPIVNLFRGK